MIGVASLLNALKSAPQPPNKQSLLLDGLRRVEQHSPVWMLPRLVQTLNLHQHLAQARQRLCDSHRAMMKDAGHEAGPCHDAGGINVSGDTTVIHNHGGGLAAGLGKLLLCGALPLAAGYLGAMAWDRWHRPTTPVVVGGEQADWKLGIQVKDRP